MTALAFEALSFTYPGAAEPVLRDVTFSVEPGEFVVLAGCTGSGKSTLLGAAAGLVPHFHGGTFAGRVVVGGLDTRENGPAQLSAVAGSLFQDPETQVIMGTVRGELAFPLENRGWAPAAVARGVEEAALALGIGALLDRPTHELSGGELQRVVLGAALAGRPELVLLDEPTSQLDPVAGDELLGVLRRLNEEWGTAVVIAEHRLERCLAAADRVVALAAGAVACDAAPRDFLAWAQTHAPDLQTPGARLFALAGLTPPPSSVKEARATLRASLRAPSSPYVGVNLTLNSPPCADGGRDKSAAPPQRRRSKRAQTAPALRAERVWFERSEGAAVLRDLTLHARPGEIVALMGRNGAGKSTLLRLIAGLEKPTRGSVTTTGRVALLLQNPGDYFVRDRVGAELPAEELGAAGLSALAERHPRDLSGGERQRLALAIVTGGDERPALLCLDEPTRGMDRARKRALAAELEALAAAGSAVILATHDAELAAETATRTVLLGDGAIVADAATVEVLAGGWYFATQTARILAGAANALTPEEGAQLLRRQIDRTPSPASVSSEAAAEPTPSPAAVEPAAATPEPGGPR